MRAGVADAFQLSHLRAVVQSFAFGIRRDGRRLWFSRHGKSLTTKAQRREEEIWRPTWRLRGGVVPQISGSSKAGLKWRFLYSVSRCRPGNDRFHVFGVLHFYAMTKKDVILPLAQICKIFEKLSRHVSGGASTPRSRRARWGCPPSDPAGRLRSPEWCFPAARQNLPPGYKSPARSSTPSRAGF